MCRHRRHFFLTAATGSGRFLEQHITPGKRLVKFLQEKIKNRIFAILKNDYEIADADLVFSLPAERKFGY
jgi:hypothetical protein